MEWTRLGPPIDVRPLFPVERAELLALLGTLDESDWLAPTACPGWTVHDLAAHLVHDYLRRLSGGRDGWSGGWIPVPDSELGPVLNRANDDFVAAAAGLSPRVLVGLLAGLGAQLDAYWATCDLDAPGLSVSWAAPDVAAPNWLDIAREYSEFWVHQQQLRAAVGRPGADSRQLTHPAIDTLLRALPRALPVTPTPPGTPTPLGTTAPPGALGPARTPGPADTSETPGAPGAVGASGAETSGVAEAAGAFGASGVAGAAALVVTVVVGAPVEDAWTARRDAAGWALRRGEDPNPDVRLELAPETLWRVVTRGLEPAEALQRTKIQGDTELATAALSLVSIVR